MKLLFVAPILPYPPLTGSALITLNHIRHLSIRHKVDLISFRNRTNATSLGDLPNWCNHIELVDRPARWRVSLRMLHRIARDPDTQISRFSSEQMSEVVDRSLANATYDVVLFQTILSAQFRPDWYHGLTIWSLEDPLALKTQRMLRMYRWYSRPFHLFLSARLQRYDVKQAPRFECVTFVNREDALEYKHLVHEAHTDWVPHGIDGETYPPSDDTPRRDGMIVITGNMFHLPNVDAVEFFCREVFPLVCKRAPSSNLWLVGANPGGRIRKWAKNSRIKVTGFVPNVRTYLRQAIVSVCPIRLRIGTQTKILEALACGTPVVTSSAGNHGIGAVSGEHLYIADDPVEFAEYVVALLQGHRWDDLSQNGRRFVVDNFTWETSTRKLEQILEGLVFERKAASALA